MFLPGSEPHLSRQAAWGCLEKYPGKVKKDNPSKIAFSIRILFTHRQIVAIVKEPLQIINFKKYLIGSYVPLNNQNRASNANRIPDRSSLL
jgi:hypothetical protein